MSTNNTEYFGSKVVFLNGLPMTLPVAASDPGTATAGDFYYNTTSNTPKYYNGSAWVMVGDADGTVTSVSVVSANGLAGTVANATTTPAITLSTTITGILQGNGTAISAASTTGSGNIVLATSPTLVTPALGTPSSVDLVNAIGLPLTSGVTGVLPILNGGTGSSTSSVAFANLSPLTTAGDIIYENSTPAPARLAIGSSGQVLTVSGGLPAWETPASSAITFADDSTTPIYSVSGSGTNSIAITLVNESAATVFAGPVSGGAAQPTFRALASTDIPDLSATYELNSHFAVRSYQNSLSLSANESSPTTISALTFAYATYGAVELKYVIIEASTNSRRLGTFRVTTDGTSVGYSDEYAQSAVLGTAPGILLSAAISGSNVVIQYSGTDSNACTMRCEVTSFAA
jgi:hypothetical protein